MRRALKREPLPEGAWDEALKWWRYATANPSRIASYKLEVKYVGGGASAIENSPRTQKDTIHDEA